MGFYDADKSEEFLLFGNSDYKNKIRTTVYCSPVGIFAEKLITGKEKIAVFCAQNDFPLAKKAKDAFKNRGADVFIFVLAENFDEKSLLFIAENADIIVAVGEEPLIKKAKSIAEAAKTQVAVVYSSPKITNAFGKPYADYLVIDEEFCFSNKKQFLIETFGEAVSCLTDLTDYKVAVTKRVAVYDKEAVKILLEGINFALISQNFSDVRKALAFSALKISIAKEYSDILNFSATAEVAEYLPKDVPFGERKYRAFKAIAPIYALYLSKSALRSVPDAVRASKDISDYYNESEYETVERFSPLPSESDLIKNEKLLSVIKIPILKDLTETLKKTKYIDELYGFLYSGKKKLSSFSPKELKKALKTAAYSSKNNLLALLKDDGFADFI